MRIFHKIVVAYQVTTDITNERTFSFSSPDDARAFRQLAEKQGYRIVMHSFDHLVSATDALSEIEQDRILTLEQAQDYEDVHGY